MTAESRIDPTGRVSPKQLRTAMIVLLLLLVSALTVAAATISSPPWAPGVFVLVATAYVPVVILIFL
jgi:hypothetical protein